jgi:hypothetical protein
MTLSEHELRTLAILEQQFSSPAGNELFDAPARADELANRPTRFAMGLCLGAVLAFVLGCALVALGGGGPVWPAAVGALLAGASPFLAASGLARHAARRDLGGPTPRR